jgi:hypothetical protein
LQIFSHTPVGTIQGQASAELLKVLFDSGGTNTFINKDIDSCAVNSCLDMPHLFFPLANLNYSRSSRCHQLQTFAISLPLSKILNSTSLVQITPHSQLFLTQPMADFEQLTTPAFG